MKRKERGEEENKEANKKRTTQFEIIPRENLKNNLLPFIEDIKFIKAFRALSLSKVRKNGYMRYSSILETPNKTQSKLTNWGRNPDEEDHFHPRAHLVFQQCWIIWQVYQGNINCCSLRLKRAQQMVKEAHNPLCDLPVEIAAEIYNYILRRKWMMVIKYSDCAESAISYSKIYLKRLQYMRKLCNASYVGLFIHWSFSEESDYNFIITIDHSGEETVVVRYFHDCVNVHIHKNCFRLLVNARYIIVSKTSDSKKVLKQCNQGIRKLEKIITTRVDDGKW